MQNLIKPELQAYCLQSDQIIPELLLRSSARKFLMKEALEQAPGPVYKNKDKHGCAILTLQEKPDPGFGFPRWQFYGPVSEGKGRLCQHLRNENGEHIEPLHVCFHENKKTSKLELPYHTSAIFNDQGDLTGGSGSVLIDPEKGLYQHRSHNKGVIWCEYQYTIDPTRWIIENGTLKHNHGAHVYQGKFFFDYGLFNRYDHWAQYQPQWNPPSIYEIEYKDDAQVGQSKSFYVLEDGTKILDETTEVIGDIYYETRYAIWPNWPESPEPLFYVKPVVRRATFNHETQKIIQWFDDAPPENVLVVDNLN